MSDWGANGAPSHIWHKRSAQWFPLRAASELLLVYLPFFMVSMDGSIKGCVCVCQEEWSSNYKMFWGVSHTYCIYLLAHMHWGMCACFWTCVKGDLIWADELHYVSVLSTFQTTWNKDSFTGSASWNPKWHNTFQQVLLVQQSGFLFLEVVTIESWCSKLLKRLSQPISLFPIYSGLGL